MIKWVFVRNHHQTIIMAHNGNPDKNEANESNEPISTGNSINRAAKIPKYDPAESIEQYLDRVDFWFELERVESQLDKFRQIMPYLPATMFSEVRNAGLAAHPTPYAELKRILKIAFGMNELERVRKLTETIQLGDRRPGDILRDMQQLAVTSDENIIKSLWLQRLPADLGAALSVSLELPISSLREMANTMHGFICDKKLNQIAAPAVSVVSHTQQSAHAQPAQSDISQLVVSIGQLVTTIQQQHAQTIAAIERTGDNSFRGRSNSRNSFRDQRSRSPSRDSAADFDNDGRCWYHRTFNGQARKCKPGCSMGGPQTNNQ